MRMRHLFWSLFIAAVVTFALSGFFPSQSILPWGFVFFLVGVVTYGLFFYGPDILLPSLENQVVRTLRHNREYLEYIETEEDPRQSAQTADAFDRFRALVLQSETLYDASRSHPPQNRRADLLEILGIAQAAYRQRRDYHRLQGIAAP